MSLDAEARKSGFLPGLVADALKRGESLPSLSGSFHLVNVDSDTCHQILFAKCWLVLNGRQYGLQTVRLFFFYPKNCILCLRETWF